MGSEQSAPAIQYGGQPFDPFDPRFGSWYNNKHIRWGNEDENLIDDVRIWLYLNQNPGAGMGAMWSAFDQALGDGGPGTTARLNNVEVLNPDYARQLHNWRNDRYHLQAQGAPRRPRGLTGRYGFDGPYGVKGSGYDDFGNFHNPRDWQLWCAQNQDIADQYMDWQRQIYGGRQGREPYNDALQRNRGDRNFIREMEAEHDRMLQGIAWSQTFGRQGRGW